MSVWDRKDHTKIFLTDRQGKPIWLTCVYDDACGVHESACGDLGGVCGVYGGDCDCDRQHCCCLVDRNLPLEIPTSLGLLDYRYYDDCLHCLYCHIWSPQTWYSLCCQTYHFCPLFLPGTFAGLREDFFLPLPHVSLLWQEPVYMPMYIANTTTFHQPEKS